MSVSSTVSARPATRSLAPDSTEPSLSVPQWLVPASLLYLALPHVVFLLSWLQPEIGIVVAVCLVAGLVSLARAHPERGGGFSREAWLGVGAFSVGLTWLSGAGDLGYQALDWWKHNAVFSDLVARPWPVVYDVGQPAGLDYYLAHYLPAATVGKAAGWGAANVALAVWTALGFALLGFWLVALVYRAWRWALVGFVALSGLDVVGWLLFEPLTGAPAEASIEPEGVEFWNGNFVYPSQLTSVADAPHQSIGVWLVTALALWFIYHRGQREWWAAVLIILPFWSVLATVGLLPFAIVHVVRSDSTWAARLKSLFTWRTGLLVPAGLIFVAYFAARTASLPDDIAGGVDIGSIFTSPRYDIGASRLLVALVLFLALELVLPALIVVRTRLLSASERHLGAVSVAVMVLVLPVKISPNHDLMQRGSAPALFIVTVIISRLLARSRTRSRARSSLVALLIVGGLTPAVAVVRALTAEAWPAYSTSDQAVVPDLVDVFGETPYLSQYVAGTDSFFWSTLARD